MVSTARSAPVDSPAPRVIRDTITGPVSNGSPVAATESAVVPAPGPMPWQREIAWTPSAGLMRAAASAASGDPMTTGVPIAPPERPAPRPSRNQGCPIAARSARTSYAYAEWGAIACTSSSTTSARTTR